MLVFIHTSKGAFTYYVSSRRGGGGLGWCLSYLKLDRQKSIILLTEGGRGSKYGQILLT